MLGRLALARSMWRAWRAPVDRLAPERLDRGAVFLLDGIGGTRIGPLTVGRGLYEAGIPHALEEFYWSAGFGVRALLLSDLRLLERNREQGRRLADRIREYRASYPGRPVHVLAMSGGTGPAAFALEALRSDEAITGAVFVASALSPTYDLTAALSRSQTGIVSVSSAMDFMILGLGTQFFGTVDRRFTPAAGMVGFRRPSDAPRTCAAYRRLRQVFWRPEMMSRMYFGDHFSVAGIEFAREVLAGYIAGAEGFQLPCRSAPSRRPASA
jgi:hypothetical protein